MTIGFSFGTLPCCNFAYSNLGTLKFPRRKNSSQMSVLLQQIGRSIHNASSTSSQHECWNHNWWAWTHIGQGRGRITLPGCAFFFKRCCPDWAKTSEICCGRWSIIRGANVYHVGWLFWGAGCKGSHMCVVCRLPRQRR